MCIRGPAYSRRHSETLYLRYLGAYLPGILTPFTECSAILLGESDRKWGYLTYLSLPA